MNKKDDIPGAPKWLHNLWMIWVIFAAGTPLAFLLGVLLAMKHPI